MNAQELITIQQQQIESMKKLYFPHIIEALQKECKKYNEYIVSNNLPSHYIPRGVNMTSWIVNKFEHENDSLLVFIPDHYHNF